MAYIFSFADNDSIEGMAFPPDYRPRGPPPAPHGKPLLDLSDHERLDGFFAGFDSNNLTSNNLPTSGAGMMVGDSLASNEQPLTPQYFIGSHTHMQGQPPFVDPNALETEGNIFNPGSHLGSNVSMPANRVPFGQLIQHTPQALPFANYQTSHHNSHNFFDSLTTPIPTTFPVPWHHSLASSQLPPSAPRPLVRFGSDSHFRPSGYVPPLGSADLVEPNEIQRFEWLEGDAQSSTPNTQSNTEPSSPVWTRKQKAEGTQSTRILDDSAGLVENAEPVEQAEQAEQGEEEEVAVDNPERTPSRKRRKVTLKTESHPPIFQPSQSQSSPTTTTTAKSSIRGKRKSLSAITTAITTSSTSTSPTQPLTTSKPPRSPSTGSKPKPKRPPAATSNSAGSGSVGAGARVPLTSDQKRANHTNSEQRRRDQAQRAFARLFDLVPELEREGKLSQMKKLERVVKKIRDLQEGNRECRRRIDQIDGGVGKKGDGVR